MFYFSVLFLLSVWVGPSLPFVLFSFMSLLHILLFVLLWLWGGVASSSLLFLLSAWGEPSLLYFLFSFMSRLLVVLLFWVGFGGSI